jgi:hypothetical protein
MAARNKWIPIVIGIVIFVVVVGIGLVAGLVYFVSRQVDFQTVSAAGGEQEFAKLRAGFEGQTPFIELPADGDAGSAARVHRELAVHEPGKVSRVCMRIWSPQENKLVRLDIPFWTIRLMGNNPISLDSGDSSVGHVSLKVTPQELEKRGPGLVIDHRAPDDGPSILVWLE